MLNEPATRAYDRASASMTPDEAPQDSRLDRVRGYVAEIFMITAERTPETYDNNDQFRISLPDTPRSESIDPNENVAPLVLNPDGRLLIVFEGKLKLDSEAAYAQLDEKLAPLNLLALFRQSQIHIEGDEPPPQRIYIVEGRVNPKPRSWRWNLILLVITIFSVLSVGMDMAIAEISHDNRALGEQLEANGLTELWRGLPYALSILLILGAHEMGHYFAARRHKIDVTLPYFLPFPFGIFGTFGAFIQMRQPIRNRKMLLEIGAAGPLAGLLFAIPILLIGLATSRVEPPLMGGFVEGNSILYALAKILVFGRFLPDGMHDVIVNQLAWAGWTGLFVTGLNLIPVGQLDGGHVLYSLLGNRARFFYFPLMAILTFLVIISGGSLLLLLLLLFLLGRAYAVPLDDITPLDPPRRWLALGTLLVFALAFVPVPLTLVEGQPGLFPPPGNGSAMLPMVIGLIMLWTHRTRTRFLA